MSDHPQSPDAHIDERLRTDPIIWLATVRPDGRPHMVAVWFLWDGTHIVIFSRPGTQKIRNLRQNTRVSLALDDTHGGDEPIVIEGTAELLDTPELTPAMPAYATKYEEGMRELKLPPPEMAKVYSQAIRITPTRFV